MVRERNISNSDLTELLKELCSNISDAGGLGILIPASDNKYPVSNDFFWRKNDTVINASILRSQSNCHTYDIISQARRYYIKTYGKATAPAVADLWPNTPIIVIGRAVYEGSWSSDLIDEKPIKFSSKNQFIRWAEEADLKVEDFLIFVKEIERK